VLVELLPEALAELHTTRLWYEEQRIGLGDDFFREPLEAMTRIGEAPEA
jgi:hypothetical protein